jgi:hypothetical protein
MNEVHGDPFQLVAQRAQERARFYRRWAWRCLWIPGIYIPAAIGVVYLITAKTVAGALLMLSVIILIVAGPVFAGWFFSLALRERSVARRNEQAIGEAPLTGEQLLLAAQHARQTARNYQRWRPLAFTVGVALFTISLVIVGILLAVGVINWGFVQWLGPMWKAFLVLVILILVAFFASARLLANRAEKCLRQAEVMEFCQSVGFSYRHKPAEAHLEPFAGLPLLRHGQQSQGLGTHLMAGEIAGRAVLVLVYGYQFSHLSEERLRQSVIITSVEHKSAGFRLWPEQGARPIFRHASWNSSKESRRGLPGDYVEISFPLTFNDESSQRSYRLFASADEIEGLVDRLAEPIVACLAARPVAVAELANGLLALYEPGNVWESKECSQRIAEALALGESFDAAYRRDQSGDSRLLS